MGAAVAVLWHMHQPYYRNPIGGEYRMPWTFLHASKDYRDMLKLAEAAGARVTFNLVPSLLDQLEDYTNPDVNDTFLNALRVHPSELSLEAKAELLPKLLYSNLDRQIKRIPRYFELHEKIWYHNPWAHEVLTNQDFLDLEVLFLLAWTGEVFRSEEKALQKLLEKGAAFSQTDKNRLLKALHKHCGLTMQSYRKAGEDGVIEISTSPYYHPILPLLIDPNSAREAMPNVSLPAIKGNFGDDGRMHIEQAVKLHRKIFGKKPKGFWPSEGSVGTEALSLLAEAGISWTASDEDILAAAIGEHLHGHARRELYRPHEFKSRDGKKIKIFFRDKALSDLIGFSYSNWNCEDAANDFVGRLAAIAAEHGPDATISVILDGENAWECYDRNGAPFLTALYKTIDEHPDLHFSTFSECSGHGRTLTHVPAGSWIYGSFSTWIGHPEKNRAWELLDKTRRKLKEKESSLSASDKNMAWKEIMIAEGSDWFWWLGDDHYSPQAGEFDQLFRLHLMNVYHILGLEPPMELHTPIKQAGRQGLLDFPSGLLSPKIDGRITSYFEWLAAGCFDLTYDSGTMKRTDMHMRRLDFGSDGDRLFLCIRGEKSLAGLAAGKLSLEVEAFGKHKILIRFPLSGAKPSVIEGDAPTSMLAFSWGDVGEVSIPLKALKPDETGNVFVSLRLIEKNKILEKAPLYHSARLPAAAKNYYLESWTV